MSPRGVAGKRSKKFGNYRGPHLSSSGKQGGAEERQRLAVLETTPHDLISFFLCLFVLRQSCVTGWLVLVLTVTAQKIHSRQDDRAHHRELCMLVRTHTPARPSDRSWRRHSCWRTDHVSTEVTETETLWGCPRFHTRLAAPKGSSARSKGSRGGFYSQVILESTRVDQLKHPSSVCQRAP